MYNMSLTDMVALNMPFLGEVEAAAFVWYLLGMGVLVFIGLAIYLLSALEKSILGGGGLSPSTGGSVPEEEGLDDGLEDHEGLDDHGPETG